MSVCVRPRDHKLLGRVIAAAFQLRIMAFAVDCIDRHGPNNEMLHQLQPKKTNYISRLYSSKRHFSCPLLLTRRSVLVLKVGVSYWWQSL